MSQYYMYIQFSFVTPNSVQIGKDVSISKAQIFFTGIVASGNCHLNEILRTACTYDSLKSSLALQ